MGLFLLAGGAAAYPGQAFMGRGEDGSRYLPDFALMSMMRSQSCSCVSRSDLLSSRSEQFKRAASSLPNRCMHFCTQATTSASFVASATMVRSRDSSGTPVGIAALRTGTAASSAGWLMSISATVAPSTRSRPALSTPILPPPPVMKTTLPSRRCMGRGRERLVAVGARSIPGRTGLFRFRVDMPRAGMRGGAGAAMVGGWSGLVQKKRRFGCVGRYRQLLCTLSTHTPFSHAHEYDVSPDTARREIFANRRCERAR